MGAEEGVQTITLDDSSLFDQPMEESPSTEVNETQPTEVVESAPDSTTPDAPQPQTAASQDESSSDKGLEIQQQAKDALSEAGLDLQQFTNEYAENGSLSEESFDKLEKDAGIPRSIVESYIAGQQLIAEQATASVTETAYTLTGGEQEYRALTDWAGDNLTEDEVAAYNESVGSMDKARADQAIRALIHRRDSSDGYEGQNVRGATAPSNNAGDIFKDRSQLQEALADPRYSASSAFRSQVENKLQRSMNYHGGDIPL